LKYIINVYADGRSSTNYSCEQSRNGFLFIHPYIFANVEK